MEKKRTANGSAGYLVVDVVVALALLTVGFFSLHYATDELLRRSLVLHSRLLADIQTENDLAARWAQ